MMQKNKTYIIAEAGVNHNGSEKLAFSLLEKAAEAKADCIKFQTFKSDLLCNKEALLANYQACNTKYNSQKEMLQALELPYETHFTLKVEAEKRKIDFLSTPFDINSLKFLIETLGLKKIKISSGDLSNSFLLYEASSRGVNVIISTGMANIGDIEFALASLAWGYKNYQYPTSTAELLSILEDQTIYDLLRKKVEILHCTSSYPANFQDINLSCIQTFKNAFSSKIGYSDHSVGIEVAIAAVVMGAEIIEKHVTLDKNMEGPDHKASLDFCELKNMISCIRNIEQAIGSSFKHRLKIEREIFEKAHKRILASGNIEIGEKITLDNIILKRNNTGKMASSIWDTLNQISIKNYKEGDPI